MEYIVPSELVDMVCQYLAIDCPGSRQALTAMHSMSVASKTYNQLANPYLYRHIDTRMCNTYPFVETVAWVPKLAQLIKILDCRQWGASPLSRLQIPPPNCSGEVYPPPWVDLDSNGKPSARAMQWILTNTINIQKLTLTPSFLDWEDWEMFDTSQRKLPNLKSLAVCSFPVGDVDLCHLTKILRGKAIDQFTVGVTGEAVPYTANTGRPWATAFEAHSYCLRGHAHAWTTKLPPQVRKSRNLSNHV